MNRLLKRQIKNTFGDDFDFDSKSDEFKAFIEKINLTYNESEEDVKLLQRTIELNSEELTEANQLIRNENLDMIALLKQYKNAIDSSLIVSKTDLNGYITFVNQRFCELSGYTENELLGHTHNIIKHPDVLDLIYSDLWDTIKSKNIWRGFLPNQAKDGSTYYVNATIFPILDNHGEITEYMAIREDVTKNINLQKRSEYLHNRTKQIMDSQESIIVISNDVDGVVDTNEMFFELTGFKNLKYFKEKYLCVCELFIKKEGYLENSTPEKYWGDALLAEPNALHKAIMKNSKGEDVIFSVVGKTITLDNEEYLLSTFSNITDLENMRVKSEVAEKSKSEFLANMSHEIRTPMNGISGFLQLLEKTNLSPQQEKYLNVTQSSVNTLLQIINDILDFSKLGSGKMISELIEINPFVELEKAFIPFLPDAREKNISYQIHIDSKLEECLLIDELHIRQVMQNLINNALKFTPENGTVMVQVIMAERHHTYDRIRFLVQDSGIGIAKENQDKIMSAFSQADNSTTRKFGGTGLGLSISSSLVELMGGTLQIDSEIDKGSTFYFDLDIQTCSSSKLISKHLDGKNLCLVNDNHKEIKNIKHQLDHFKIAFSIVNVEELEDFFTEDNECHLLITLDETIAKEYSQKVEVILLSEENHLTDSNNVEVINLYPDCPSQLYNRLLHKDFILKDTFAHNYQNNIRLNILIAEDYEINQMLIEEHLKKYKEITFTFANNGQEAVDILSIHNNYDLIFMDINMPVLDGIEATKKIRSLNIKTPIIALTANALEGDRERFLAEGMDDYISKPIDFTELERILEFHNTNEEQTVIDCYTLSNEDIEKAISLTKEKTNFPPVIVNKLLNSYATSSDALLETLKEGLTEDNYEKIARAFHDLKSSSLTLNFTDIALKAADAEHQANNEAAYEYQKLGDDFSSHFRILKKYIKDANL